LVETQNPVVVWGAGNFTMRLLKDSVLNKCNIVAFIDNDSTKWGKTIKGISVYPPDKAKNFKGALVICSALGSDDILSQIKTMGAKNDIIVLK
jgi:FlaA1/EpsC-like NDP-sugar epimerase